MSSLAKQISVPIFSGQNYDYWAIKMKTYFQSQKLWEIVEEGVTLPEESSTSSSAEKGKLENKKAKDSEALYYIQTAVADHIFPRISVATSAKEAWSILQKEYQGSAKVRIIKLQTLRRDFENMKMKDSETIDEYYTKVRELVNQLKAYGEDIPEKRVVEKLLISVTEKYDPIVTTIEETKDITTLTATRPDIMFATCLLSRFMQSPSQVHYAAAKRILRYLRGTKDFGIWYKSTNDAKLVGYTDSDWAGSVDDMKSTSGYTFSLGSGIFSWASKKQATVAQSSVEAEYIAAAATSNQAIWLRRILEDIGEKQEEPTTIYCDNKSAIAITKNPVQHSRTKHIDIKYHSLREATTRGEIELKCSVSGPRSTSINCFSSSKDDNEQPLKERKGWSITIHDLSGSPVAAASMVTPFVPSPGSDRVSRSNPGAWLILRPGQNTWKPWGRLEAWRDSNDLGYRFELIPDGGVDPIPLANSSISTKTGGKFSIDITTGPTPVASASSSFDLSSGCGSGSDFGSAAGSGSWAHLLYRGFVMSSTVEGDGKCSKPEVEVGVQHVNCTEDAAAFVALAAAMDLSLDACRLFSQKLRKELREPDLG
ncbi:UNVERIFIED_CONTAM: Retrovirus-related Pol polyprotein from transposon RE1 [Sesamum radiatum]|uniref:Retrovirus-related Pol polyprotein from transposon RE1 n=2 Tax=Sesamum radiatum TaxID=300843 RepID=A0AAW2S4S6_SESRA